MADQSGASPAVGALAPGFTLRNQRGESVSLDDFKGRSHVVLYFYPRALTPGCTVQACGLRDSREALAGAQTAVLGISPDPVARLQRFAEKHALDFDLLSDEEHHAAEAYGTWRPKKFMGRLFIGQHRSTFIIDRDGILRHVMAKVRTRKHHDDVLSWIGEHL